MKAGRLPAERAAALGADDDLRRLLAKSGLDPKILRRGRRAAWIDRLVAGLTEVETGSGAPVELRPLATSDDEPEPLVPLLLDALTRRAADREAGAVGRRASARLRFVEHAPGLEEARAWAQLQDDDLARPLAHLLVRQPGAAARIAALVRAGMLQIVDATETPPAPERTISTPPGARTSLAPQRDPLQVLTPGATESVDEDELAAPLLPLPHATAALDDGLLDLERRLAHLEEVGAPGPERAEVWREFAQACQRELGSLEEAARAYREAAAADPTDYPALRNAATLCASMGRLDLAQAYAEAATAAAPHRERAGALEHEARMLARAGTLDAAWAKLDKAIEEGAGPEARLLQADLTADEALANDLRRQAALELRATHPGRARLLLASVADNEECLRTLARWRAEDGHVEAAVFGLHETVEATDDLDRRRTLRTFAAELAEEGGRPDLAFELLATAHAQEPFLEVLYEPLVTDAASAGWGATVAVWMERLGTVTEGPQRARWLMRAARSFEQLPGGEAWASELAVRALAFGLGNEAVTWLRERAERTRDTAMLADAFERAAAGAETEDAVALLVELADLAEERLGTVQRALWAWRRVQAIHPDHPRAAAEVERLEAKARIKEGLLRLAEEDHARDPSAASARRLAAMLRDHPDQRRRAIELYREAIATTPEDRSAAAAIERLLRLEGDEDALLAFLVTRAEEGHASRTERLRVLSLTAGLRALRGDLRGSADACLRLLELAPQQIEATARLELAATIEPDPALRTAADAARLSRPVDQRHARAHARAILDTSGPEQAATLVRAALDADPRAADALRSFLRVSGVPTIEHLDLLTRAREICGPEREVLARGLEAARLTNPAAALEWSAVWTRLDPLSLELALDRLELATKLDDASAIAAAAEHAIAALGRRLEQPAQLLEALGNATRRLSALGQPDRGAMLLLHAIDRTGQAERLLPLARELAQGLETRIAVAERRVAWAPSKVEPLRDLAALHRQRGHRAAEARALLRLLAQDPRDEATLLRLATLYAETGEHDRLMAVLALRLECAPNPEARLEALRDLAGIAASLGDEEQAEGFLTQLEDEYGDPVGGALLAAAVLVSAGHPEKAIALLQHRALAPKAPHPARLLERAVAIAERFLGDETEALEIAIRALQQGVRSPALMLAFERLALGLEAVERAQETYGALVARSIGRHGRRGTRYRQGRWLERAGLEDEALEAYSRAFEEFPSEGVLLSSIERLARSLGRWELIVQTYTSLAARLTDAGRQVALMSEVARIREQELGDIPGAFEILHDAWRATQRSAVVDELRRLARAVAAQDPTAGATAMGRLIDGLRQRIDMTWDSEDQVRTLTILARVHAEDRAELEEALRILDDELLPKAEAETLEVPRRLPALACCWAARWLLDAARPDDARERLAEAERWAPGDDEVSELRQHLSLDADLPPATGSPQPQEAAQTEPDDDAPDDDAPDADEPDDDAPDADEPDDDEPDDDAPDDDAPDADEPDADEPDDDEPDDDEPDADAPDDDAPDDDAPLVRDRAAYVRDDGAPHVAVQSRPEPERSPLASPLDRWRSAPAPVFDAEERALRDALASGDLDAGESLGLTLIDRPDRLRDGIRLLLHVLREDPSRVEAIRGLHRGAAACRAPALAATCADIRSLFDGSAARTPPNLAQWPQRVAEPVRTLLGAASPLLRALNVAWRSATPLFRRSLRDHNVLGTQRITPLSNRPMGAAFAHCQAALGSGASLYLVSQPAFGWVAADPIAVLAPEQAEHDPATLRARLGRALELAHPEHALLVALPPAQARIVTDGLWAAFGPARAVKEVDREAARLASDLWRMLPGRSQTALRELFENLDERPSFEDALDEARRRGARAALMVDGSASIVARALLLDDPTLRSHSLETPLRYAEACRASGPLRSMLRLALSDLYLAAR